VPGVFAAPLSADVCWTLPFAHAVSPMGHASSAATTSTATTVTAGQRFRRVVGRSPLGGVGVPDDGRTGGRCPAGRDEVLRGADEGVTEGAGDRPDEDGR